jgi:DNA-binding MarR family transcriptional regulator
VPRDDSPALIIAEIFPEVMHRLRGNDPVPAQIRGLTLHQLHALHTVRAEGNCTMGGLARRLHISLGAATGLVDRLIQQGLLERRPDAKDRRIVRLQLTERGRRFHGRGHREASRRVAERLSVLTPEEQTQVAQALLMLRDALSTRTPPGE